MSESNRNKPCPCNSGRKYKKCCILLDWQRQKDERDERRRKEAEAQRQALRAMQQQREAERQRQREQETLPGWPARRREDIAFMASIAALACFTPGRIRP